MKIGIVGCGLVGSTSGFALVMNGVGRETIFVDINRARAEAEANDILQGRISRRSTYITSTSVANPAAGERLASDTIELSARQNFALWLAGGEVLRGWGRSTCGDAAESLAWIDDGI